MKQALLLSALVMLVGCKTEPATPRGVGFVSEPKSVEIVWAVKLLYTDTATNVPIMGKRFSISQVNILRSDDTGSGYTEQDLDKNSGTPADKTFPLIYTIETNVQDGNTADRTRLFVSQGKRFDLNYIVNINAAHETFIDTFRLVKEKQDEFLLYNRDSLLATIPSPTEQDTVTITVKR